MWHVDIGQWDELQRTHSDAICATSQVNGHHRHAKEAGGVVDPFTRGRSHSGDSYTLSRPRKTSPTKDGDEGGGKKAGVAGGDGGKASVKGVAKNSNAKDDIAVRFEQANGHGDDVVDLHHNQLNRKSVFRRSQSLEDVLTALPASCRDTAAATAATRATGATGSPSEVDFQIVSYSEPDDVETGGEYTLIFDESDEDPSMEMSMEVRDLMPLDPLQTPREGVDGRSGGGLGGGGDSVTPPRATSVLISAFLLRLESVMVNGIHYPPGLFFVQ